MTLCFLSEIEKATGKHREIHKVHQVEDLSHSSRIKLSLVGMSVICFFGVNEFDLDLGVQIDSVEWPIKSNSVGSWHVSHRRISVLNNHFDHSFVVFKKSTTETPLRRICVCGAVHIRQLINISDLSFVWVWICDSANGVLLRDLFVFLALFDERDTC